MSVKSKTSAILNFRQVLLNVDFQLQVSDFQIEKAEMGRESAFEWDHSNIKNSKWHQMLIWWSSNAMDFEASQPKNLFVNLKLQNFDDRILQ